MSLPAHENTWVFDVNGRETSFANEPSLTDETSAARLILHYKQALCGHVRHGHSGTFAFSSPTVTLTVTNLGGFPAANMTSDLVGKTIEIVGSTTPANDGYFTITSVTSPNIVEWENASGVAEAFTGSYRILNDKWTALPNGRSPWKCKGSGAGTTGKGAGMDGIDRWADTGDLQASTSASGNRSWFVFQNEESGAELCVFHYTSSSISEYERMEWVISPIQGFTGGATNARPTATDEVVVNAHTKEWLGTVTVEAGDWKFYLMMTDDGLQTMFWMTSDLVERNFFMSRLPSDVVSDSAVPWNGTRNMMGFTAPGTSLNAMTVVQWNDSTKLWATIDKDASAGGLYKSSFRLANPMFFNNTAMQYLGDCPQQILNEYHAATIKLECTTTGVRGSHGRIADLFFAGESMEVGMPQGAGMPGDATRIWIRVADFIVPWNGENYRR